MKLKLSGSLHFANGTPVPNATVRVFDQDADGKLDDDLTVTPGVSDERGRFRLVYEPLRYLDFHTLQPGDTPGEPFNTPTQDSGLKLPDLTDIYLPYLQFTYLFNGSERQHRASLGIFKTRYHLPENPPVALAPSVHGFKFTNSFSGYFLPYSTPAFMSSKKVSGGYGLCGGMCSAALDFALAGRAIPPDLQVPKQGTRLQRYLFRRQMDSLGGLGKQVVKVAQWTSLPDDTLLGTQALTAQEFALIRPKLDDKNPVILALIYKRATSLKELSKLIFDNHQVLAYAYDQDASGVFSIHVYDPNLPGRDDVTLRCEPVVVGVLSSSTGSQPVTGLRSTQVVGNELYRQVRGFFPMPYEPVEPPKKL